MPCCAAALIECVDIKNRLLGKSKRASSCVVLCIRSSPLQSIVLVLLFYHICVSKLLLLVSTYLIVDASKLGCGKLSKDKRFTNLTTIGSVKHVCGGSSASAYFSILTLTPFPIVIYLLCTLYLVDQTMLVYH